MDSVSHTTVAHYLLNFVEKTDGISFDRKAFVFGNLKPDLRGEYLTKRHYPSLMFDEVMQRIRDFVARFSIRASNGARLSEELGVICHYLTDFFCFPHNDTIYGRGLFAHYVYEKRTGILISRRIDAAKFESWVQPCLDQVPQTVDALIACLTDQHRRYAAQPLHSISDDLIHICRVLTTTVLAVIRLTRPAGDMPRASGRKPAGYPV